MDLLTIRDLKQGAGPVPQSVGFRAQLEKCLQKTTKTGNPFYELTFADDLTRSQARAAFRWLSANPSDGDTDT